MVKAVLAAIAVVTLGQWGIGTASADESSYISTLRNFHDYPGMHYNQPTRVLLSAGYLTCANAQDGLDKRALMRDVMNNYGPTIDPIQTAFLVNIALEQLCT